MEWFTPDLIGVLTPAGLCCLFVFLFLIGKVVPKSTVDDLRKDRDASIARIMADRDARIMEEHQRAEDWKLAHQLSEEARMKQAGALAEQTEVTRTASQLIRTLRDVLDEEAESGRASKR